MEDGFSVEWQDLQVAIIGMGLMGGSYAEALRSMGVKRIIGFDKSRAVLALAQKAEAIDEAHCRVGRWLAQADVVICCIYPQDITAFLTAAVKHLKSGVLVTDISGIKGLLLTKVEQLLPPGCEFIGGHPMAGREGSGFAMAGADIFAGASYIITPTKRSSRAAVSWLRSFAEALGCTDVISVSSEEHDSQVAYTSDLPHVVATALMNCASFSKDTASFCGGAFRDMTRVADINPALWAELLLANGKNVAAKLHELQEQLALWDEALQSGNEEALTKLLSKAGKRKRSMRR